MEFARHSFSHSLLLELQRKLLTSDASLTVRYAYKYWSRAVNFISQLLSSWCTDNTAKSKLTQTNRSMSPSKVFETFADIIALCTVVAVMMVVVLIEVVEVVVVLVVALIV
jgi:hypothetical protein